MRSSSAISLSIFFFFLLLCSFSFPFLFLAIADPADETAETNATESRSGSKADSFANMIDRALEKEFPENEQAEASYSSNSGLSVPSRVVSAMRRRRFSVLERYAVHKHCRVVLGFTRLAVRDLIISTPMLDLGREYRSSILPTLLLYFVKNHWATIPSCWVSSSFSVYSASDSETNADSFNNSVAGEKAVVETVARFKHKKNETKEEKSFHIHDVFNLDSENHAEDTPTLIDRRVITGYLLAGSVIGPGGFNFVSEMVQVETVAQFGVIFLLFALGLEFSTTKVLRVVRAVAVVGGLLQILLFMCLCGITASLCGGKPSEGVFVGVFLSMSSTAVGLELFTQLNKLPWSSIPGGKGEHLGDLIINNDFDMQVLKFLMEKNSISALYGQVTIGTLILQDCTVGLLFALLPVLSGTSGVLQGVISMTKLDKLGLSLELGSFAAGVMISTTDLSQHTLEQVEPIRNFFAALFLASIGMLIHVHFLWNHVDILLAAVILVVILKTIVITSVVKGFGYTNKTSVLVGISLAQIGEFAFVLLSRASNLHLVEGKLYLLLLGTTALILHLGALMRWFSPDSIQNEEGPSDCLKLIGQIYHLARWAMGRKSERILVLFLGRLPFLEVPQDAQPNSIGNTQSDTSRCFSQRMIYLFEFLNQGPCSCRCEPHLMAGAMFPATAVSSR
ncbi:hypothetical protein ACLOJK_040068 [Asimina triloba]